MKRILTLILLTLAIFPLYSETIGVLPIVLEPDMIRVQDGEMFVVEKAGIFIFNLEDLKLKKYFGRMGEGPKEFKNSLNFSNTVRVYPDHLLVESADKISRFTRKGEFIDMQKKLPRAYKVVPVGDHFVILHLQYGDKVANLTLSLCDAAMKPVKEIYRQPFSQKVGRVLECIPDALHFCVYQDNIFVEKSPEGFVVDVYDAKGEKLRRIQHNMEPVAVGEAHKKQALDIMKNDPVAKIGGWEKFEKMYTFDFPVTLPAIKNISASGDRLYVQTYVVDKGNYQFLVLDLEGKILKTVFLPVGVPMRYMYQIAGVEEKYYSIHNGKIYYIDEDDEKDEYVIRVETI